MDSRKVARAVALIDEGSQRRVARILQLSRNTEIGGWLLLLSLC